jgi:hypothetical protein
MTGKRSLYCNKKKGSLLSIFFLVLTTILISACERQDSERTFNAKVLHLGLDCGDAFLIQFNSTAADVPVNSTNNIFYEIDLPNRFKVNNMDINVTFRTAAASEAMLCTTQDIAYKQVIITTTSN